MNFRILYLLPLLFLFSSDPLQAANNQKGQTLLKGSVKANSGFLSRKTRSSQTQRTIAKQDLQESTTSTVRQGHVKHSRNLISSMLRAEFDGPVHGITGNSR
jgi:hypothetical protein